VKADLGADSYCRESVDGFDVYLVVHPRAEGGDEVRVGGVEGRASWDIGEEVTVHEFVLWTPNLPSLVMEDGVEVGVSRSRVSTRRRSEKVGKEVEVDGVGFVNGGRRLYSGGGDGGWVAKRWGWAPDHVFE